MPFLVGEYPIEKEEYKWQYQYQGARGFEDLMSFESHDMPYFFDKIFSVEGWGAKSLSKKKFKLLKNIDIQVRAMLNEDEKVHFISWGVQSSFLEAYFIGWAIHYISRMALVFTNQRILLLQISSRNKPLSLRCQVRYTAITKIGSNCQIEFQSQKKLKFLGVPGKDRKSIPKLIDDLRSTVSTAAENSTEKENLCPYCYAVVDGFPQNCPQCLKSFKSANKAGWLSLVFPGFGDFYLGHRLFAGLEIIGAVVVWSFFLPVWGLNGVLIVFIFMHGIDALETRHVGRKGLYPSN